MNAETFIGEMANTINIRHPIFVAVAITVYLLLFGNPFSAFYGSRKGKNSPPQANTKYLTSLHNSVKTFDYSPQEVTKAQESSDHQ